MHHPPMYCCASHPPVLPWVVGVVSSCPRVVFDMARGGVRRVVAVVEGSHRVVRVVTSPRCSPPPPPLRASHVTRRKPQITDGVNELIVRGCARWGDGTKTAALVPADIGSQAFALAPPSFFPLGTLQPARKPLSNLHGWRECRGWKNGGPVGSSLA